MAEHNDSDMNLTSMDPHYQDPGFCSIIFYRCCRKRQFRRSHRVVKLHNRLDPPVANDNSIKNTKYNLLTFLPLFFYNQFKFFFNFYYLCLCMSQFYEPLKIGFLFTYIGPLAFVIFLSLFNEIVDEVSKYLRDYEVNSEKFKIVMPRQAKKIVKSGNLQVGDLVFLDENDRAPADLVILSTTDPSGRVYIRTDQIDGETDSKLRKPTPILNDIINSKKCVYDTDVEFVIPKPNPEIYNFEGAAHIIEDECIKKRIPLELENTVWGGCRIAKGAIVGLVAYNGQDSKLMMNASESEPKRSLLNDQLNTYSKVLFTIMLFCSCIIIYLKGNSKDVLIQIFRYVLLLSTIIPISMKVNHDISRLYYSARINSDKDIKGCQARNSNVCEDLGRIEYFLSDKTGTLTKNIMVVRKFFIRTLGEFKQKELKNLQQRYAQSGNQEFNDFTNLMMVCHSVAPTKNDDGHRILESASPDEISFIQMMEKDNFKLLDKTDNSVTFEDNLKQVHNYNILVTFPFTSERKRMGVICQKEGNSSEVIFYLKGADSMMKKKLSEISQSEMMEHAEDLSNQGLRTLGLAKKVISVSAYQRWKADYDLACASLKKRNEKMEACLCNLEKDMTFVGVDLSL